MTEDGGQRSGVRIRPLTSVLGPALMTALDYHFLPVNGLRMHVVSAGPKDGPLVVLLHGFPEFWYGWRHQIPALATAGFRVIAPDQRGYSLTDKTPPFDLRTLAHDVVELIRAHGRERAHVIGHDWGAAVAWALAGWHPEAVDRLVILNVPHPNAMAEHIFGGDWRQRLRSWYIAFFQIPRLPEFALRFQDFASMRRMMKRTALPGTFSDADLNRYAEAWRQPGALSAMIDWYRQIGRGALRGRSPVGLPEVTRPTLMLWGERDMALGVELAEDSRAWATDLRLVRYPDATHWLQHEKAEDVNREIVRFLSE